MKQISEKDLKNLLVFTRYNKCSDFKDCHCNEHPSKKVLLKLLRQSDFLSEIQEEIKAWVRLDNKKLRNENEELKKCCKAQQKKYDADIAYYQKQLDTEKGKNLRLTEALALTEGKVCGCLINVGYEVRQNKCDDCKKPIKEASR